MAASFWQGRRVLITGHTGFKGAWLSLMLARLGAKVTGFALAPPTQPSLFELAGVAQDLCDLRGDVADLAALGQAMDAANPEIIFHMAAQSLVKTGYSDPVTTYLTNVMGTVHLLEAARHQPQLRAVVIVTSDKCYENREWIWGYRESDALGGRDPYANSKACAELVTSAYRASFFEDSNIAVASARAGNVLGGGDFAADRIVPDAVRAFLAERELELRAPDAVRPWQHVLEPLYGYMLLAERAFAAGSAFAEGWNFGPSPDHEQTVETLVSRFAAHWDGKARWRRDRATHPHEAHQLRLDAAQARARLGWVPLLGFDETIQWTAAWYLAMRDRPQELRAFTLTQVDAYLGRRPRLTSPFDQNETSDEAKRIAGS